ncbi:MAG: hypothetical protein ACREJ3_08945 [Polyangiaceae bacterium]
MPTPAKRRLPILPASSGESGDDPPPKAWHWVGFGAVAIFTAWLPASVVAGIFAAHVAKGAAGADHVHRLQAGVVIAVAYAAALAVGAALGGYVVGRWGSAQAGIREAALAGLAAAVVASVASWSSFGMRAGPLLVVVVAVPAAALGGKLGLRRRAREG